MADWLADLDAFFARPTAAVSPYLDRPRRSLDEVVGKRIELHDRVSHPDFGVGEVLLTAARHGDDAPHTAYVAFAGASRWLAVHHLTKVSPAPGREPLQ